MPHHIKTEVSYFKNIAGNWILQVKSAVKILFHFINMWCIHISGNTVSFSGLIPFPIPMLDSSLLTLLIKLSIYHISVQDCCCTSSWSALVLLEFSVSVHCIIVRCSFCSFSASSVVFSVRWCSRMAEPQWLSHGQLHSVGAQSDGVKLLLKLQTNKQNPKAKWENYQLVTVYNLIKAQ